MRKDARFKAVPVILMTGNTERKTILQAASLGVSDYLLKSRFSLADLLPS